MCSRDELLDDLQDQLIPKSEPIDIDFIKTEEFEEEGFVDPEAVEVYKDSIKDEILENEKGSASNVRDLLTSKNIFPCYPYHSQRRQNCHQNGHVIRAR